MTTRKTPSFTCEIRVTTRDLMVSYTVRNDTSTEVVLFNRIRAINLDDTLNLSPQNVYVDLDDSVLHLQKRVLPVPENLAMGERVVPFITRVAQGVEFKEQLSLGVPVRVCNPIRRAVLQGSSPESEIVPTKPETANAVRFSVGGFRVDPSLQVHFHPVSSEDPGVFRTWPPIPSDDYLFLLSHSVALGRPVEALQYTAVARS